MSYIKYFIIFIFLQTSVFTETLIMVTGDEAGNYHKGGITLQKIARKAGIEINLINTDGSFQNVIELGKNSANLGIAQVDVLIGMTKFNPEYRSYTENCHAIAPTELEYVHIVVNNESGIQKISDLKDKLVSLGSPNSGTAFSAGFILAYTIKNLDITKPNFLQMDEAESLQKVARKEIDAAFITTSPNSSLLKDLPGESNIRILSYKRNEIPAILKKEYHTMIIPRGAYPWLLEDSEVPVTASFLLVSKSTNKEIIKKLINVFYDNEKLLDEESHLWTSNASSAYTQLKKIGIPYHKYVDEYIKNKKKK